jgi:hypothetical protein
MAEFHCVAKAFGQEGKELLEHTGVPREVWRELPQDWSQPLAQEGDALEEFAHELVAVLEALLVGDLA